MSRNQKAKRRIFDLYSCNLDWVKENPSIEFRPDFSNGYLCPLCFDVFFEEDLDSKESNCLTLEHVPPASLGGQPIILTCKKCNSQSGIDLDVHLMNILLENDFNSFLPNSESKTTFKLNDHLVNGKVEIDEKGVMNIHVHSKRSNPMHLEKFNKDLFSSRSFTNAFFNPLKRPDFEFKTAVFTMIPNQVSQERRAEIALLRIAYLIAYATLGNGFLINRPLSKVRQQILKPDEKILPKVFWINYTFPKDQEGIHIISLPKEAQSFLVVFSLKTKSQMRQFAIVLPGPSLPGLQIYDFIEKNLCNGDGTTLLTFTTESIAKINYLEDASYAFIANDLWQKYTSNTYKSRFPSNQA